jgi:mono/diheme cytochrome c family protein
MAATDQTYRHQRTLDIVFAVSCVLMLLATAFMFGVDYAQWGSAVSWKQAQKDFRDVEVALNELNMLKVLPNKEEVDAKVQAVADARKALQDAKDQLAPLNRQLSAEHDRNDQAYRTIKATYDSKMSYRDITAGFLGKAATDSQRALLKGYLEKQENELVSIREKMNRAQDALDETNAKIRDEVKSKLADHESKLSEAEDDLKKMTGVFDRYAKTTVQKQWGFGDWFRSLPIIDGFASPTKINQFALNDLTIDYSFKDVPRYDRCTTCHVAIERAAYDRATLELLSKEKPDLQAKLDTALELFKYRKKSGESLGFDPDDLPTKVKKLNLTKAQLGMYAAHPRLGLFVDGNSPHPAEKFGCTICHAGQGSATDFQLASHTPADAKQREEWEKDYHWHATHDWEYPMLSRRFVESSCLKCHHQVTDLISYGSREEAPKLIRGFNLVRENGCFGCHEISSLKSGKLVGPDIRLEPSPALEWLSPSEQDKARSDPLNPPGTYRKVGPSLRRLAEKTNEEWTRKWILSPRGFREDTKMPHFYGLSNNNEEALPPDQKKFPDTEIHSIAYYLLAESKGHLNGADTYRKSLVEQLKALHEKLKEKPFDVKQRKELDDATRKLTDLALLSVPANATAINDLNAKLRQAQQRLQDKQDAPDLDQLTKKLVEAAAPTPIEKRIADADGNLVSLPDATADKNGLENGKKLFTERGCLACHSHDKAPVAGDANFGPNLSRIGAKIAGDEKAKRRWLVQWILNPSIHHPRTRMPVTHLKVNEAADVADWLLSEKGDKWEENDPAAPELKDLVNLARVYLAKAPGMTRKAVDDYLPEYKSGDYAPKKDLEEYVKYLPPEQAREVDERYLQGKDITPEKLKWYIGKKSINRLGCYACHDVPGFEQAKPIGTALNDWGKKDAERLAFEDADAFVKGHFNIVAVRDDEKDPTKPSAQWQDKNGKPPIEKQFADALEHHTREGFLHLKLAEPRSFDYERLRAWDDRLRMPQFAFARSRKHKDESDEEYKARQEREEAEAREAVMTFILGLVAEPMGKYIHAPKPDRLAEVKGRQVLDKFNCASCHQLRSGVYEFKSTEESLKQLEENYDTAKSTFNSDHVFLGHNAWKGTDPTSTERLTAFGTQPKVVEDDDVLMIRLTQALRFAGNDQVLRDLPAGSYARIPRNQVLSRSDPHGGVFAELMTGYLTGLPGSDPHKQPDEDSARDKLPPPLLREGERVQPNWLYQFLVNPKPIRPQVFLRMPKFNMSTEEASALTNYFAAVDRLSNPGAGLSKEFVNIEQHSDEFWRKRTEEYVSSLGEEKVKKRLEALKPTWKKIVEEQIPELERRKKLAEEMVNQAKDENVKKAAQEALAAASKELNAAKEMRDKNTFEALDKQWRTHDAYAADGYRLLVSHAGGACFTCHSANGVGAAQAPPLELSAERLRPEWTARWLANPARMFPYSPKMPTNFPASQPRETSQELFDGPPLDQIMAIRDVLLNFPKVADMPVNRFYRLTPAGGK